MRDALGAPQDVLVLGGASAVAGAVVRALPRSRLRRVVLAGRPSPALDAAAAELAAELAAGPGPGADVPVAAFDAADPAGHGAAVDAVFDGGDVDVAVLAFGVLGDQGAFEADPAAAAAAVSVTYTGAVSAGLHVARRLAAQGHGTLVVLSSVAAVRARRANFVYGSAKAGLDAFAQGLADALAGSGAGVLVVRPGFVRSPMTAHLPDAPLAVDPAAVGAAVAAGLARGRTVVYVPAAARAVAAVLRVLPRPLLRRLRT